jgi:cob(I)alamin adenosyltransferase
MKLYTGTGDDGTTGMFGGDRVGKDHPRIEAYGSVDELNALIGLAVAVGPPADAPARTLPEILGKVQSRLFDLGADLATPQGGKHEGKVRRVSDADVREVESWIDAVDAENEPLRSFVLPAGSELSARLHVARTVCRRAERRVVNLSRSEPVNRMVVVYLNRVSDLLFAMARRANALAGVNDVPWRPGEQEA